MKLQPSLRKFYHAPCHFMQRHIHKVHVCLAVTCHLHFWQNDWDLLHATAVTWEWNRYRNKSHHRKSTLEKKILPLLLQGFEPATFQSWVWRSSHWAIPPLSHQLRLYSQPAAAKAASGGLSGCFQIFAKSKSISNKLGCVYNDMLWKVE